MMTECLVWTRRCTVVRRASPVWLLALLSGCAGMSDRTRTMTEAVATGAAIGAGAGYLIGEEKGAAVGAAVGAVGGVIVGTAVNQKKEAYARNEDELQLTLAALQQSLDELRAANQQVITETLALRRRQKALQSQKLSENARQAELRAQK